MATGAGEGALRPRPVRPVTANDRGLAWETLQDDPSCQLVGPNGAGKTTLLESLLSVSGAISRKGRIADKNTVGDASAEARERQMSTEVNVASFQHAGHDITVVDCPGSVEFVCEAARQALVGADLAIIVVEPVIERVIAIAPLLQFLDQLDLPHIVFINKMDRSEVRYRDLLQALREVSSRPVVPHQYAIGRGESLVGYIDLVTENAFAYRKGAPSDSVPLPDEYREREQNARREMLETLADFDDDLMEKLLEDQEPPTDQILADLRKTLGSDQVVPVFMGVAEHDMGVRRLLEAIAKEAPDPGPHAADARGRGRWAGAGPGAEDVLLRPHRQALTGARLARHGQGRAHAG